jgi:hypothetical protein
MLALQLFYDKSVRMQKPFEFMVEAHFPDSVQAIGS